MRTDGPIRHPEFCCGRARERDSQVTDSSLIADHCSVTALPTPRRRDPFAATAVRRSRRAGGVEGYRGAPHVSLRLGSSALAAKWSAIHSRRPHRGPGNRRRQSASGGSARLVLGSSPLSRRRSDMCAILSFGNGQSATRASRAGKPIGDGPPATSDQVEQDRVHPCSRVPMTGSNAVS